ncbi:MAG: lysophospholipid acyltransferase family protein [Balneolaceae bacterium]
MSKSDQNFIAAAESRWITLLFDIYVRTLFRRRFKYVRVDLHYQPGPENKSIYYLNHTSWWDGLIPLILNRKIFRQNARAMMEDKQMKKYPFFKKLGAFSVNTDDTASALPSLRYAAESLQRSRSALYIYPEGKIMPFTTKPDFKKGLGWISNQCPAADVVPIGIFMHTARYDKPELFIRIGKPVAADHSLDSGTLNEVFELEMGNLLRNLKKDAYHYPDRFKAI